MDPLVTPEDFAGYLQRDLDRFSAEQAIAGASGLVRDYLGWAVSRTVETFTLDSYGSSILGLPTLKVNDVLSVTLDGEPVTDYTWGAGGMLYRCKPTWPAMSWPTGARRVVAEVDHGYDEVPDAVRIVTCAIAARHFVNPEALRSKTVGETSRVFLVESIGREMTQLELALINRYKLP